MTRILIVEDEESYREPLVYQLTREGYDVSAAATGEEGFDLFTKGGIDLVLLDLMLPGIDGIALCRRIREQSRVPIIMVTAKGAEIDKVVGLEIGADDYVTKPYSFRELLARIRAVLRRDRLSGEASAQPSGDDVPLVCGGIVMNVGSHQVTVRGKDVFFPLKEFELLEYLMQNKGHVLTRHQLIDRVWGSDYVGDTKTLDVHVKRVRAKIEEVPGRPRYLTTVRGLGYKIDDPDDADQA
ncbi:response regulator transcription factor [Bifidobacterium pullorum subsp. saeculare]|uniref:Sensory transduction protein RegX3 n=1 Tax=Bifidobacterium pullorum subsp. saeculare TaxID=78257 RepID=A0A938WZ93_9BIFI|nr:response regulator transcription factor [Bifidobacterium pullorum]MBM6700393.1 response regulator transcription factor [Bifidobacterium pullorum subsp. saeculare]